MDSELSKMVLKALQDAPDYEMPDGETPCTFCNEKGFLISEEDFSIKDVCPKCKGTGWISTN